MYHNTRDRQQDEGPALNWLLASVAVAVTGFAAFAIWSAGRVLVEYFDFRMPHAFSPGFGWSFGVAWLVAFASTFGLSGRHSIRMVCVFVVLAYFIAVTALVFAFLMGLWSPTWSLS